MGKLDLAESLPLDGNLPKSAIWKTPNMTPMVFGTVKNLSAMIIPSENKGGGGGESRGVIKRR